MDALIIVVPVLFMLGLGVLCRRIKVLSQAGVGDLKQLVMKIMLPVAIFQALGSASYTVDTVIVIAVMLCAILVSFGLGYAIRYLMRPPYRKYIPFLVSIYEGGMIGYPLYTSLCGAENLSHIALLDVACLLFGFGVYMGLLQQAETGQRAKIKELALSALKNPTFIATVLGIAAGATGLLQWLLDSGAGGLYLAVQNIITVGMSALILLVVGYDLDFSLGLVLPCLKAIAFRIVVQSALAAAVIAVFHALFGENVLLSLAVIMLMASPAPFSMQSYLRTEEGSHFVSTFNSLYCIVTVIVYIIIACLI